MCVCVRVCVSGATADVQGRSTLAMLSFQALPADTLSTGLTGEAGTQARAAAQKRLKLGVTLLALVHTDTHGRTHINSPHLAQAW